jgi:hypothetical protein
MKSPLPLLVVLALAAVAAAGLIAARVPTWIAVVFAIPFAVLLLPVLDAVFSVPMRIRNHRVYGTPCRQCARRLGEAAQWRIEHPDYEVECPSCGTVNTFDACGRLKTPGSVQQ